MLGRNAGLFLKTWNIAFLSSDDLKTFLKQNKQMQKKR